MSNIRVSLHSCVLSQLYLQVLQENGDLKEKLQETQLQLNESKVQLEKLKQVRDPFPFLQFQDKKKHMLNH